MAERTITQKIDDLDGTSIADCTINFSIDGVGFTIDLCEANAAAFAKAMRPYRAAARLTHTTRDRSAIREWAREAGFEVSDRGRLKDEIVAAYEEYQRLHG